MSGPDTRPVVVTGGATGIGRAVVDELLEHGYAVIAADLDEVAGDALARTTAAEFVVLDVSVEDDWRRLTAELGRRGARGLVNNAGIGGAASVVDESLQQWHRVLSVNQTGVFLGMREMGELIRSSGGGAIVNLASIFSSGGGFGNAIAYHATKGAVAAMTKNAALHWAKAGVRVNSIHPGFVATPMTLVHQDLPVGESTIGRLVTDGTPMGRMGKPREIASAVEFLLSDRSSYVTGAEFYVDGGWSAH